MMVVAGWSGRNGRLHQLRCSPKRQIALLIVGILSPGARVAKDRGLNVLLGGRVQEIKRTREWCQAYSTRRSLRSLSVLTKKR